ncbi:MAG: alpha/beta hydrolase [Eubacterium sp.]|nr:alpha/beta hydrolase [Eubacterium sp.]
MSIRKYPIKKEFYPFAFFATPTSKTMIKLIRPLMKLIGKPPKDPEVERKVIHVPGYDHGEVEIVVFTPKDVESPAPCLINYHGGGFMFEAFTTHYKLAIQYAKKTKCKVFFVNYRLVLDQPMPYPQEDSFAAYKWITDHAEELGIDPERIGVMGDSAGGTLAVTTCLLARDRGLRIKPAFQMLYYPSLDTTYDSASCKRYTDTPVWNSTAAVKLRPLVNPNPDSMPEFYYSPLLAENVSGLPKAYIEVAEYDCLHDDGVSYAERLRSAGVKVLLKEVRGTMHSFDMTVKAPTTVRMMERRARFIRRIFTHTKKQQSHTKSL